MLISIIDPIFSTTVFIVIFAVALLASFGWKKDQDLFPLALTQELKGLAILAIVFSHVGYFLSTNQSFLFPLSILGGVGVNLFLFLSGFGLTRSALKEKISVGKFYKKRLLKLFTPFWFVIVIIFLLDFFILHLSYSPIYIVQSLLGFFPRADLFLDVNSPLWFFTPILFYYLIFPLVFLQKRPWLTAIIIYIVSYFILQFKIPVSIDVLHLYQFHLLAFPLGIAFASLFLQPQKIKFFLFNSKSPLYYVFLVVLAILIGFFAYHSGVGEGVVKEQTISLLTMSLIIIFFIMKKVEIKLLYIFGLYSFEIYLIHWPLMSRLDLFFRWLPGWLAMVFYLGFFLLLAWGLRFILNQGNRKKRSP